MPQDLAWALKLPHCKVCPCPGQVELGLFGWLLFYPFACLFTTAKLDLSLLFSYPLQTSRNFCLAY